jgi:glycosyltransferase involved in cell wall biosynthesis
MFSLASHPMKVLLHSYAFWPSLGGIEIVSDVLARGLIELGCECTVVTETPLGAHSEPERPYEVVRRPSTRERWRLARRSSVVHANGATLAMYPYARLAGVPFVWTHNGYQVSCVDGLGWAYGGAAPMQPLASLRFHARARGVGFALKEALKLGLRRMVAQRVDMNLAGSRWVAERQPLPRQVVTYNPYPLARFRSVRERVGDRFDFLFVGRLVSEKGADVLVRAFARLVSRPEFTHTRLGIAGGGDMRPMLEDMVTRLGIAQQVEFLGALRGDEVPAAMALARIGVVPSTWEEPYGGVSLEWLAAGRNIIVSSRGGHAECVGAAGLHFDNGDDEALYRCMARLMSDPELAQRQREHALELIQAFDELRLASHFIDCYRTVVRGNVVHPAPVRKSA